MRGISPRLGGVGWAASFAGFISCIIYNILLGVAFTYLTVAGDEPWSEKNYKREPACNTADRSEVGPAELYLYMDVTKVLGKDSCTPFVVDRDEPMFAGSLFAYATLTWVVCFFAVLGGPKSIGYIALLTATLPFIFMVVTDISFMGLNDLVGGNGGAYYWGSDFTLADGTIYDPMTKINSLLKDAYAQVFFSTGVCVGIYQAYASYNPIKQPVISLAIGIAFTDLFFAIIAGFTVWGAIGFLMATGAPEAYQTTSVGLAFIAMPTAAA